MCFTSFLILYFHYCCKKKFPILLFIFLCLYMRFNLFLICGFLTYIVRLCLRCSRDTINVNRERDKIEYLICETNYPDQPKQPNHPTIPTIYTHWCCSIHYPSNPRHRLFTPEGDHFSPWFLPSLPRPS